MRIIFMGSPDFAVPSLEALAKRHEVVCVVSQPDKPKGRSKKLISPAVKVVAQRLGLTSYQPKSLRKPEVWETLASYQPDLIVVAAYGKILPKQVLEIAPHGCFNVHGSMLPAYRGASPMQQVLLDQGYETGITIMQMDEGLDTGDILLQASIYLDDAETYTTLSKKLSIMGGELLIDAIDALEAGTLTATAQNDALATHTGLIQKSDGYLNFQDDAYHLDAQVRAFESWPTATCQLEGQAFKIYRAHVVDGKEGVQPGTVIVCDKTSLVVQCGVKALALDEVQLSGKKRMSIASFVAGRKIPVGTVLQRMT